jgi:hypothetical protein
MLPIVQGENVPSPVEETGLMRYLPLASHEPVLSGQQAMLLVHPGAQSCYQISISALLPCRRDWKAERTMAPKLCPVSWATICHSALPAVDTAVPEMD